MNLDLHDALTALADTGPHRAAPTARLLTRVHRRRASRAVATSAVGVGAAGALAVTGLGWWPEAPHPAAATSLPTAHATPAPDVPPVPGSTAAWDLYPDSALDVSTAPTRAISEALAALSIDVPEPERPSYGETRTFLMDPTDGAWVRAAWPADDERYGPVVLALSPDGRTVAAETRPDEGYPGLVLIDVATGARTDVVGLEADGRPCIVADADFAPDGTGLAVLTNATADGPVLVFRVDLADRSSTLLATLDGASLAEVGALGYSPDGSLLAVGAHDDAAPYTGRAVVLDRTGGVVREWDADLRDDALWYGNDALRASGLEETAAGGWRGYLVVSTGDAIGEVHPFAEPPWVYGTPPTPVGATTAQFVSPHARSTEDLAGPADPAWLIDVEDVATGRVRAWLPVTASAAPASAQPTAAGTLAVRTR